MNKKCIYMKQVLLLATGNKLRFILILIGTLVGVYIYATGNLALDSVYYAQTKEFRCMPDNSFFVLAKDDIENVTEKIMSVSEERPMVERISSAGHVIYENGDNDIHLIVYARLHGVSDFADNVLLYSEKYGINMSPVDIVSGRSITSSEIKNNELVCVIDQTTEKKLFGDQSGVGKYIYFNKYNGGMHVVNEQNKEPAAYEVVGIMADSFYTKKEVELEQQFNSGKDQHFSYVNIICPYDYYKNIGEDVESIVNIGYMWEYSSKDEMLEHKNILQSKITNMKRFYEISDIIDKEYKYKYAKEELDQYQFAIDIATILLFIIMGVSCMSIIFFAMKERVSEIGIKKAFGASMLDIMFQFWLENLFIILISVVSAIMLGFGTLMLSEEYIKANFYSDFEVHITIKNVIMPLLLGLMQGMIFTIIPCVRYSIINVTKALKLDK